MKRQISLITLFLTICSMVAIAPATATVNTGTGTQQFVDALRPDDAIFEYQKGDFVSIFGSRTQEIKSGTWMTTGFGVTSSIVYESCQALIEDYYYNFLIFIEIQIYFDGELIENLYDPLNPDELNVVIGEDGSCQGAIRFHYYITPQSVGMHHLQSFLIDNQLDVVFELGSVDLVVIPRGRA